MSSIRSRLSVPVLIALLAASQAIPGAASAEPAFNPRIETPRAIQDIRVDGRLDDAAWQTAARATGFVERFPGDNLEPQVDTEALVTYDDGNFYVAFICRDDPARVRATMTQRDQYGGDDEVILCLDTSGDAAWAYEFCVNPYGVQKDLLWTFAAPFDQVGREGPGDGPEEEAAEHPGTGLEAPGRGRPAHHRRHCAAQRADHGVEGRAHLERGVDQHVEEGRQQGEKRRQQVDLRRRRGR